MRKLLRIQGFESHNIGVTLSTGTLQEEVNPCLEAEGTPSAALAAWQVPGKV